MNSPAKGAGSADSTTEQTSAFFEEMTWQGPLPPPGALRAINELVPNGAERLIAQLENETKPRHLMESRQQPFPLIEQLAGRLVALIFALACLGAIVVCAQAGAQIPASILGGAIIVAGMNALMRSTAAPNKPDVAHPRNNSER